MKKFYILIWFCLLIPNNSFPGDAAGNGQGIAEKNMALALLLLPKSIDACLSSESCLLSVWETRLLEKIKKSLPEEGSVNDLLSFQSEKKSPGKFIIDGELKIAKTGDNIGSKIFINIDLLYPKDPSGIPTPLSVASCTATLIHELGHHQGEMSHQKLDILGSKVETFLRSLGQEVQGSRGWENVHAMVLSVGGTNSFNRIVLNDGKRYLDLTQKIVSAITCDSLMGNLQLVGARIWNLHWKGGVVIGRQFLQARIDQFCKNSDGRVFHLHGYSQIKIKPNLKLNEKRVFQISEKIEIEEIICAQNPKECD